MVEFVTFGMETGDKSHTVGELQNVHSANKLNRKNYLKWNQLIKTILKGKGKVIHLTDTTHYLGS